MTAAASSPAVLLLHPLGVDRTMWDPLVERLDGMHAFAIDLLGHGAAPPPQTRSSVEDYAAAAADLLRRRDDGPVHVVGVSLGGLVAQVIASAHPELVARLVIVDAVPVYPEQMRQMWRDRATAVRADGMSAVLDPTLALWFTQAARERSTPEVARARDLLAVADPEGYARSCEVLETADTTDRLPSIVAPTLVVCGTEDAPAFTAAAPRMTASIPDARLEWIEGARHAAAFERPDAMRTLLQEFLVTS
jgi:3-oxoadipate enol-lactonase